MNWFQKLFGRLGGGRKAETASPVAQPESRVPALEPAPKQHELAPPGPTAPAAPGASVDQSETGEPAVATDGRDIEKIRYLGPGVSSQLEQESSQEERLRAAGLPVIHTPRQLAAHLKTPLRRLRWLAYHAELATRTHYVTFQVPKRTGGHRTLMAPQRDLRRAQRWIFENILQGRPVHEAAHGFVTGRGTLSNATLHAGKLVVINLDLADYFPSIGFARVRSVFRGMGYSPAVATILALLCTECPRTPVEIEGSAYLAAAGPLGLPQGACTSPALSNLVSLRLDRRLTGLARRYCAVYTRYADDLTFSGGDELGSQAAGFLKRVGYIVRSEGFSVQPSKTRVHRRSAAQSVTGLVVNDRPRVPRTIIRRVRAILHRARFEGLDAQNLENHPHFRAWLDGMIAYIHMTDPGRAQQFRQQMQELETPGGPVGG